MENATVRVIEQKIDVPMPEILEEIVEIDAIVEHSRPAVRIHFL